MKWRQRKNHRSRTNVFLIHVPSTDSQVYILYRFKQRIKSLERIKRLNEVKTYNFSAVFSAAKHTPKRIKTKFLELLELLELLEFAGTVAITSKNEELYQMNFDLFNWSS
jgi:hypothetical protein